MAKTFGKHADRVLWMDRGEKAKSRARPSNLLRFVLPALLLIVSALFYVWTRIQVIQLGYEISSTLKGERTLEETNKKLRVEIATLKSYARIERLATEELGMSKPRPDQVVVIR